MRNIPKAPLAIKPMNSLWAIVVLFFGMIAVIAHAYPVYEIALPNGEYIETNEDLKVKVIGGSLSVKRVWGNARWNLNPEWADLKFTFDPLDNSVKAIDRGGAIYARSGAAWFLETNYHIQQDGAGYRWGSQDGSWVTYDSQGRITAAGDRNVTQAAFAYNGQGQRTQVKDGKGNLALSFTYNGAGLLETVADRTGRKVTYTYTNNRLTKVTDVKGNDWNYAYDNQGQIQSRTDPEGNQIKLFYIDNNPAGDWNGTGFKAFVQNQPGATSVGSTAKTVTDVKTAQVGTYTDADNNVTTWQYQYNRNSLQHTVTVISPKGVKTAAIYDKNGSVLQRQTGDLVTSVVTRESKTVEAVQDARGSITRKTYDGNYNALKTVYPDGSSNSSTFNANNQRLTRTDELGTITQYEYDQKGNLVRTTEAKGLPEQRVTENSYDGYGQLTSTTLKGAAAADDITTQYKYDDYGNSIEETNAAGFTTKYSYDVIGKTIGIINPRGGVTEYENDQTGNIIKQTEAKGTAEQRTLTIAYDKNGNRTAVTDAQGNSTKYFYDKGNRLTKTIDAVGGVSEVKYDADGYIIQKIDADGGVENWSYDSDGRISRIVDSAGNTTDTVYGGAGSGLEGLVVARQYVTYREDYRYNLRNLQVQTIQTIGANQKLTTQTEYDAAGNFVKGTSALGQASQYSYDALGQLVAEQDYSGGVTRYQYNASGQQIAVTDAKGSATQYEYDKLGRRTKETRPMGEVTTWTYDAGGNLSEHKSASGRRQAYTYNGLSQKIKEEHYLPNQASPGRVITYGYDINGKLSSYDDAENGQKVTSAIYVYDAANRKTSQTIDYGAFSKTHTFAYSAGGKLLSRTDPDNVKEQYTWNTQGQLQQIVLNEANTISLSDYQWDMPQTVAWPNGVQQTSAYDTLMRLQSQQVKKGGDLRLDRQYAYNEVSYITRIVKEGQETGYGYDALGRLTGVAVPGGSPVPNESYTYDAVNNRLTDAQGQSYTYNQNHQLLAISKKDGEQTTAVKTYTYNEDGHLAQEIDQTSAITREYGYDADERLIEIKDSGATVAKYQYDPFGRRISKETGGQITWFGYTDAGLAAEYTEAGTPTVAYGYWPDKSWQTNPLYKREAGNYSYYHNDHLGTPQRLTNQQGDTSWAGTYEAFGKVKETTTSTANPQRFPGQYQDNETNLYQNYHRDYDPSLGRYIESDPLGLDAGVNTYTYTNSRPVVFRDAWGLLDCSACECPDKDCCNDSQVQAEFREHGWGGLTVCCCGEKIPCVNPTCNQGKYRGGFIACSCIMSHERVHVNDKRISCLGCLTSPYLKQDNTPEHTECAAYAESIRCMRTRKHRCLGNPDCENNVTYNSDKWRDSANKDYGCHLK